MVMGLSVTMQVVLLKWQKWVQKLDKLLMDLMLLEIQQLLLEKVLLLVQLVLLLWHYMVVSFITVDLKIADY
jgi:hypothetical protein